MTDFEVEQSWWEKLSGRTRARLLADPTGPIPAELVPEVVAAGGLVTGSDWAGTQDQAAGFVLPDSFQAFLQKLASAGPGI